MAEGFERENGMPSKRRPVQVKDEHLNGFAPSPQMSVDSPRKDAGGCIFMKFGSSGMDLISSFFGPRTSFADGQVTLQKGRAIVCALRYMTWIKIVSRFPASPSAAEWEGVGIRWRGGLEKRGPGSCSWHEWTFGFHLALEVGSER